VGPQVDRRLLVHDKSFTLEISTGLTDNAAIEHFAWGRFRF
jgi:hypothetical protein